MKEIFEKLSSYNIFNYLLPGILYAFIVTQWTNINLILDDVLVGAFFYYFLGLIISRIGSIIIEPLLKKISFVKFEDYDNYIRASKEDLKIEILSETNNMYRTFISLFVLIGLTMFYEFIKIKYPEIKEITLVALVTLLAIMFLFAYRKQTRYITKRIQNHLTKTK